MSSLRALRLPFAFAKRHGVVVTGGDEQQLQVSYHSQCSSEGLLEVQRDGHGVVPRHEAPADHERHAHGHRQLGDKRQ